MTDRSEAGSEDADMAAIRRSQEMWFVRDIERMLAELADQGGGDD